MKLRLLLLSCLLLTSFSFSQEISKTSKEKITTSLLQYFKQDRENIYLHLNKNTYLTNETIWFKGYVFNKNTNSLNANTSNVYISLYDNNGKEISNDLFLASNGTIDGQIELNDSLASGKYFLHIYTNFMNNFKEDESSLQEIEILNINNSLSKKTINNKDLTVKINYEGGKLLNDSENNIVVQVTDCEDKGIKLKNVNLIDQENSIIKTFSTNENGFAKFTLPSSTNKNFSVIYSDENTKINKQLSTPKIEGYNLIIDNLTSDLYFNIEIRSNAYTLKKDDGKELILLIQKNQGSKFFTFNVKKDSNLNFKLNKEDLFEGINTIRLLDQNLNQISERIVFKKENVKLLKNVKYIQQNDSLIITGKFNSNKLNISASTTPSTSNTNKNSIVKTLIFDNYLESKINSAYFTNSNIKELEKELDLFLITNTSKYKWNSILNSEPSSNYTFETGIELTIKFEENKLTRNTTKLDIFSINGINEKSTINKEQEFVFKNILALDSTTIHYNFPNKPSDYSNKLNAQVELNNNKSKFNKIQKNTYFYSCDYTYNEDHLSLKDTLNSAKLNQLNEIVMTKEKRKKFINNLYPGTRSAKAYKITEVESDTYKDVLSFIASHGYDVVNTTGDSLGIKTRNRRSYLGHRNPIVLLNNAPVTSRYEINNLRLIDVDEIYVNERGAGMGNDGMNGIISIFTKKTPTFNKLPKNVNSNFFYVKNGFKNIKPFSHFDNPYLKEKHLNKLSEIDFIQKLTVNLDGSFEYIIPHFNQEEISIEFQGVDDSGKLLYENLKINLKENL